MPQRRYAACTPEKGALLWLDDQCFIRACSSVVMAGMLSWRGLPEDPGPCAQLARSVVRGRENEQACYFHFHRRVRVGFTCNGRASISRARTCAGLPA